MTIRIWIERDPNDKQDEEVHVEVWQGGGDSEKRLSRITDFRKSGSRVLTKHNRKFDEVVYPQQMLIIRVYPKMKELK